MTADQFAARLEALITEANNDGFCYEAIRDALKEAADALDEAKS
jgi:hypothetical protein